MDHPYPFDTERAARTAREAAGLVRETAQLLFNLRTTLNIFVNADIPMPVDTMRKLRDDIDNLTR